MTFLIGLLRGESFVDMFRAAVALAVGAIPEGLPAAVTITLAIGVSRMAKRRAIVRKLPAVETLGSTTVICTDKTGTLTENQMTVQRIVAGGRPYEVSGTGYEPRARSPIPTRRRRGDGALRPALRTILVAGALCNDSQLCVQTSAGRCRATPPKARCSPSPPRPAWTASDSRTARRGSTPSRSNRCTSTWRRCTTRARDGRAPSYVKGGVEVVLERCTDALDADGERLPLDREAVLADVELLAAQGLRVLAFAARELPPGTSRLDHDDLSGLTFIGLQAMIDPPRPEAIAAVKACRTAGISVKMITGDHAITAAAIARQIGLTAGADPVALTGRELDELGDKELIETVAAARPSSRAPHPSRSCVWSRRCRAAARWWP